MGSRWARDREGGPWPLVGGGVCYLPGVWRAPMPAGEVGLERSGHTKEAGARPWGNLFVNDPGRIGGPIALLCGGNEG